MRALGKDPDDADLVELAIDVVISTWEAIGAVDIDRRLTELGAWGLPQALPEPEGATSTTKGLHRAVVELLTKRVLDGHHLAQRLQRAGQVAPAGVRQRGHPTRGSPRC
jgi:hypothetical protein